MSRAVRTLLISVVALALVVGGGLIADSLIRTATQQRVGRELQAALRLTEAPRVELGGFPFSPTLVTRRVESAEFGAASVPLEIAGHAVTLDDVSVTVSRLTLGDNEVEIGTGKGEATLDYADLSTVAGLPVGAGEEPGRLQVGYTADLFGQSLTAAVSAVPELDAPNQQIVLTETRISIAGFNLGDDVAQGIIDLLVKPIDLPLPYGIQMESVIAGSAGIDLTASVTDATIPLG